MRPRHRIVPRLLPLVLLPALILAVAACGDDKGSSKNATPAKPDADALLKQAADRMEQLKSFHFLLDHEKGTSPIVLNLNMTRAEGDVVRPDRLRADVEAAAGGVTLKFKLISIGDKARITNPFNPSSWQDLPSGTKLSDIFDPAAGTTSALRNVKDAQITGEDTINGVKVWRVEGTVDATALGSIATIAESGYTAKGTAWIGQQTPEVYRVRLEGPLGSKDTQGVIRRLEISRHDENITIDPPPAS